MAEASVKGMMILSSVVQVRRGRDHETISEKDLSQLSPETLELLDERIETAQWYPMTQFNELLELGWRVLGKSDPEYMRKSGELNAETMNRSKRYRQLDYVKSKDRAESTSELLRQLRLTSSVTLSYFNFMEVVVQPDPECDNIIQIIYSNTDVFGESLRYSTEGFMNHLNQGRGSGRKWSSERVGSTVVFSLEIRERSEAGD